MPREPARNTITKIWVRGLDLPEDVLDADVLTQEDLRDVALDHIARTCEVVFQVDVLKWTKAAERR